MDINNDIEVRLWSYIDGISDPEETAIVERLIREQAEWRSKYNELLTFNQSLEGFELEQPSMRFTKNVMEEISRLHIAPATRQYINKKIVWGIVGFFVTVIVGFLIFGFSQINWQAPSSVNSTLLDKVTGADYSRVFDNNFVNGFMMLNVVLGLMLFDRYLNDKKKKLAQSQP